ncbi:MAG: tRNA pseudouridine(55) synthase TruB, partial [Phycisphaerales bacterium]
SIVRVVKRRLINSGLPNSIKVGHGGTLDPLASGLMVILVGKATKHCDRIMAGRKRYVAEVDLSRSSTTDDLEGELTPVDVATPPTRDQIDAALRTFVGVIMQRPPDHSAVWVDGRRAYKIARKGHTPEIAPRPVEVLSITITNYEWPLLTIDVHCGKGTYIRSLARDIGAALHTGGVLVALRRTEVAPFHVDQAWPLDHVPDPFPREQLTPLPSALP